MQTKKGISSADSFLLRTQDGQQILKHTESLVTTMNTYYSYFYGQVLNTRGNYRLQTMALFGSVRNTKGAIKLPVCVFSLKATYWILSFLIKSALRKRHSTR